MIYTTLNKIRSHSPCASGWQRLLRHLNKTQADDEILALDVILDSNGLDDTLWCLRTVDGYDREKRLFAVACARRVQHLLTDQRSLDALDVAERHADKQASDKELTAAEAAARAAEDTAWSAAEAPAWAAEAAARAAMDVAWSAAWAVTVAAAARAAWTAARAARIAAWADAWAAAAEAAAASQADAEVNWQTAEFRRVFCNQ